MPHIFRYGELAPLEVNKGRVTVPKITTLARRDNAIKKYHQKDIKKGKMLAEPRVGVGDRVMIYKKKLGDNLGTG